MQTLVNDEIVATEYNQAATAPGAVASARRGLVSKRNDHIQNDKDMLADERIYLIDNDENGSY